MGDCKSCAGGCSGNCGSCGGCAKELVLGPAEVEILQDLGQFSFLPVARRADDIKPVYREAQEYSEEEYSIAIQLLEQKQLILLDYAPLRGANMEKYAGYPVHGSMGLTQRGQQVLELLEYQGIEE